MTRLLFLFLAFAASAFAAAGCSSLSTNRWRCNGDGDSNGGGAALRDFLGGSGGAHSYACGDAIEVNPEQYNTLKIGVETFSFLLVAQSGCTNSAVRTLIVPCTAAESGSGSVVVQDSICPTSRAAVPDRPQVSDMSNMIVLYGQRAGSAGAAANILSMYSLYGATNNYQIEGFALTYDPDMTKLDGVGRGGLMSFSPGLPSLVETDYPHDLDIFKCLLIPGEVITYGTMASNVNGGNPDAFFRSIGTVGISVAGYRIRFNRNTVKDVGGFNPALASTITVDSCVSAAGGKTTCTATGLRVSLGLASGSCATAGADETCWSNGRAQYFAVGGATGGWTYLNGLKTFYTIDDNTVGVDTCYKYGPYIPVHIDSSGFGAFSGTVTLKARVNQEGGPYLEPAYSFTTGYYRDSELNENEFYSQWPYFSGGGGVATSYGNLRTGSDMSNFVIDSIAGNQPVVGDIVNVAVDPANGPSSWCGTGPGVACYEAHIIRAAKITSVSCVSGTCTGTYEPNGPHGIDVDPLVENTCYTFPTNGVGDGLPHTNTCIAVWNGTHSIQNVQMLRNIWVTPVEDSRYGKFCWEAKDVQNLLFDGNRWQGMPGCWFIDGVNQSSGATTTGLSDPWVASNNAHWSNNLPATERGAGLGSSMNLAYYEATASQGANSWMENNLFPTIFAFSNAGTHYALMRGLNSGGYIHNTFLADTTNSIYWWRFLIVAATCEIGRYYNDNYGYLGDAVVYRDNIASFGADATPGTDWEFSSCWENATNAVFNNVFVADTGTFGGRTLPSKATIVSLWPNNTAELPGDIGVAGTCAYATWEQCGLGPSSPYKGMATDGGDMGVDILQLKDHVNGWSHNAGLIDVDTTRTTNQWYGTGEESQWIRKAANWTVSNTTVASTFTIQGLVANCNVHLYTDRARITEHADTAGGNAACNRTGNTVSGSNVTFAFGNHAALTPNTVYYAVYTDDTRVMTAVPFKTTTTSSSADGHGVGVKGSVRMGGGVRK